jgi:endonuclease YncB( thermonuclease family)
VIGVADGDNITALRDKEQARIRLYGIDCPEGVKVFDSKAKQFTSKMVLGKVMGSFDFPRSCLYRFMLINYS